MKQMFTAFMGFCLLILFALPLHAGQDPRQDIAGSCKVELDTYCKDVTPGKGRVLACLYAYSDKLSDPCRHAVLDAAEQAKLMKAALAFLKSQCGEDVNRICKDIAPGQGRLLNCLAKNDDKLSQKCRLALKDVGLRE